MTDFTIVRTAKIRATELARILRVHRVTTGAWLNGDKQPHTLLAAKVHKLLDAITGAVEAGELPAPPDLKGPARMEYLEQVLAKHFKAALRVA